MRIKKRRSKNGERSGDSRGDQKWGSKSWGSENMDQTCSETGVVGALPGVIGSIMTVEAIKLITNAGEILRGRLLIYDGLYAETRIISAKKDKRCRVCSSN